MLRTAPLLALLLLSVPLCAASAGDARPAVFVNSRVSARAVALNQPVRVEFTTMPRQIDGVDIAAGVANALTLGNGSSWRLIGRPVVSEHEKTKTITVSMTLLAREPGRLGLPQIPLSWLQGAGTTDFGIVDVADRIDVAGEKIEIPREATQVAGFAWGAKAAEVRERIGGERMDIVREGGDPLPVQIARPQKGLELRLRGGELAEAVLLAPNLTLDQARSSFLERWGLPHIEEDATKDQPASLTWIIGWTRITAVPAAATAGDPAGVRLTLVREDIQARLDRARVREGLFSALDTPAGKPGEKPAEKPGDKPATAADAK